MALCTAAVVLIMAEDPQYKLGNYGCTLVGKVPETIFVSSTVSQPLCHLQHTSNAC